MAKQSIIAIVAIFVAWAGMDFVIHGMLLQPTYMETAHLWRPPEEFKMGVMYSVTILYSAFFVGIYCCLINPKSLKIGIQYGALFGLAAGIGMGFGSYSYMPIPYSLAFSWFAGSLVESVVAGAIVGALVKQQG